MFPTEQSIDPIMTLEEVAARLRMSARTISRMSLDGRLPGRIQLNHKRVGFRKSAVDKFLATHERGAA
jgi:RNA polymerase primary sigma factor/RNA polymerase sigma factor